MRGTIVMPTGTGKTLVAIMAMQRLRVPTLIVVPTRPLLEQWREVLSRAGIPYVGVAYAGVRRLAPITITTYATLVRHPELLREFQFIIFDEVHHLGARTYRRILNYLGGKYLMGLTSTIKRLDEAHRFILKYMPIAYNMSLAYARRLGYVAQLEVIEVPAQMTDDEWAEYMRIERELRRVSRRLGPDRRYWIRVASDPRAPRELRALARKGLSLIQRRKSLLSRVRDKMEKVFQICLNEEGKRIIVFTESIESAERLKAYLRGKGIRAETYHSRKRGTWPAYRMGWLRGDFRVLITVHALEEGIDVPEVGVGIFVASGTTTRQIIQRVGRLVRPAPGKVARLYIVYVPGTVEERVRSLLMELARRARVGFGYIPPITRWFQGGMVYGARVSYAQGTLPVRVKVLYFEGLPRWVEFYPRYYDVVGYIAGRFGLDWRTADAVVDAWADASMGEATVFQLELLRRYPQVASFLDSIAERLDLESLYPKGYFERVQQVYGSRFGVFRPPSFILPFA